MSSHLDSAIARIRSIENEYCESQMYAWPGFDPTDFDPDEFFSERGIEFDGELFIRYPVRKTFDPVPTDQIEREERFLGLGLPHDYKALLQSFGAFHLPGRARVRISTPLKSLEATRLAWCDEGTPLTALAISPYYATSDGNSIGYVRTGNVLLPTVFEFDHETHRAGAMPDTWTRKIGDTLADFILEYLDGYK